MSAISNLIEKFHNYFNQETNTWKGIDDRIDTLDVSWLRYYGHLTILQAANRYPEFVISPECCGIRPMESLDPLILRMYEDWHDGDIEANQMIDVILHYEDRYYKLTGSSLLENMRISL